MYKYALLSGSAHARMLQVVRTCLLLGNDLAILVYGERDGSVWRHSYQIRPHPSIKPADPDVERPLVTLPHIFVLLLARVDVTQTPLYLPVVQWRRPDRKRGLRKGQGVAATPGRKEYAAHVRPCKHQVKEAIQSQAPRSRARQAHVETPEKKPQSKEHTLSTTQKRRENNK
jgi:hypothetical protein